MARNRQRARERKQKVPRDDVPAPIEDAPVETEDVALDADDEAELEQAAVAAAPAPAGAEVAARPSEKVSERGGSRVGNFLRGCWAELQRVQWPDRRQVAQATAVVLGFVVLAGVYLGIADWIAKKIVDFII